MIGDLSESSSNGQESDDNPGQPHSTTTLNTTQNPEVTATAPEKGPTADPEDNCHQSTSFHAGSANGGTIKHVDDNQMQTL